MVSGSTKRKKPGDSDSFVGKQVVSLLLPVFTDSVVPPLPKALESLTWVTVSGEINLPK